MLNAVSVMAFLNVAQIAIALIYSYMAKSSPPKLCSNICSRPDYSFIMVAWIGQAEKKKTKQKENILI